MRCWGSTRCSRYTPLYSAMPHVGPLRLRTIACSLTWSTVAAWDMPPPWPHAGHFRAEAGSQDSQCQRIWHGRCLDPSMGNCPETEHFWWAGNVVWAVWFHNMSLCETRVSNREKGLFVKFANRTWKPPLQVLIGDSLVFAEVWTERVLLVVPVWSKVCRSRPIPMSNRAKKLHRVWGACESPRQSVLCLNYISLWFVFFWTFFLHICMQYVYIYNII